MADEKSAMYERGGVTAVSVPTALVVPSPCETITSRG